MAAVLYALGFAAVLAPVLYGLWWFTTPVRESFTNRSATSYTHVYTDPSSGEEGKFPSLFDEASLRLSLVVPAYNEEDRIEVMMDETMKYLESKSFSYEIIIVDDGSKDRTTEVALRYVREHGAEKVRVMTLAENQGKGGAVQQGCLHARGEYILMVDADGATEIKDLDRLITAMEACKDAKSGYGVVVGSRAHLQEKAVAKRKWYRSVLMHGFHFLVKALAVRTIKDTQCGFKLFTRNSARVLFANLNLRRWCFDVELLYMAEQLKMPLREVAVNWEEIPGSKLRIFEAAMLMGRDLVVVRFCHTFGIWKMNDGRAIDVKKSQ
uniref:dolichyl-phosphate beta-glucosyltransferase n=1 Tax=Lotharella globosa TaxID=91324 RepID=A0A7S3YV48_9EUKA